MIVCGDLIPATMVQPLVQINSKNAIMIGAAVVVVALSALVVVHGETIHEAMGVEIQ